MDEKCKERITQNAAHDFFLGTLDETPSVEQLLDVLEKTNPALQPEVQEQVKGIPKRILETFSQANTALQQAKEALSTSFGRWGKGSSLTSETLHSTINELESQVSRLHRLTRLNPLLALERTGPDAQIIPTVLKAVQRIHGHSASHFPARSYFVRRRDGQERFPSGKRIYDLELDALLDTACWSSFRAVNWIRFRGYRLRLKGQYRIIPVPVQEVTQRHLLSLAPIDQDRLLEEHQKIHTQSVTQVEDEWRGIRFNLDTSAIELQEILGSQAPAQLPEGTEKITEFQGLVLDALDRSQENLDKIAATYSGFFTQFLKEIELQHEATLEAIRQDITEAGRWQVRMRWLRRHTEKVLRSGLQRLLEEAARGRAAAERFAKKIYFQIEDLVLRFGTRLGIKTRPKESLLLLTDLPSASEITEKAKELPPVYRRLFAPVPLKDSQFLVGRESEVSKLYEILQRWQSGLSCSVALVGPEGSGKTTLLNCFEEELGPPNKCTRKEIRQRLSNEEDALRLLESWFETEPRSDSLVSLVEKLLSCPRQVVLIEGGQNLMLRTIGSRSALEAFFYVVMSTREHFLWLMTTRLYPWKQMEYQFKISQYFTHEIYTLFQSEDDLKQAVMMRQRSSGYGLIFSDEGMEDRKIANLRLSYPLESSRVQAVLEERYFENLYEITSGNLQAALFYWLHSLSYDSIKEVIVVSPCQRVDYQFLAKLDRMYLFTLAELLNHGELTLGEHQIIFRTDVFESRIILDYLCEIQLLRTSGETKGSAGKYSLNPVFFHPVSSTLESMNILY